MARRYCGCRLPKKVLRQLLLEPAIVVRCRSVAHLETDPGTAYLTAYPWQSVTRQDTLGHDRVIPANT